MEDFKKHGNRALVVFEEQFLPDTKLFQEMKKQIEAFDIATESYHKRLINIENELKYQKPKTKKEDSDYNKLRGRQVDIIHHYSKSKEKTTLLKQQQKEFIVTLKEAFLLRFQEVYEFHIDNFLSVLNSKLYYFNKLMWIEANKSREIVNYFDAIMSSEELTLHLYAKVYLNNINLLKSNKVEEYESIQFALKELK